MKLKIKLFKILFLAISIAFCFYSCKKKDIDADYYPPVIKVGFEDTSEVTIANDEKGPDSGTDSTYVRIFKLVSDQSNNALGADVFFNFFNPTTGNVDTTAINKYIRLMNPILRIDSLNKDGTLWGNPWLASRAYFDIARKQAAIMIRTIDTVKGVPKTPGSPSQTTFLLKLIPDKNLPVRYTIDEQKSTKKVTVIDKKQL